LNRVWIGPNENISSEAEEKQKGQEERKKEEEEERKIRGLP
jgi:hypothetical protein